MFWVQDSFLKGDKHLEKRRAEQAEIRRLKREERMEKMYNMGKGNVNVEAAAEQLSEMSEDEFGNVVIKKRVARQIEEGVYGADNQDPSDLMLLEPVRRQSLVEVHNDLDAVDPDEFDRIIEREKSNIRKQKSSA